MIRDSISPMTHRLVPLLGSVCVPIRVSALDSIFGAQPGAYTPPDPTPMPDFVLTLSTDKTTAVYNEVVHFTMVTDNQGTTPGTSVVIENIVPPEFVNIVNLTSTMGTPNLVGNTVTLNLASLANGSQVTIEFDATVDAAGSPKNSFSADCAEAAPKYSNEITFTLIGVAPIWSLLYVADDTTPELDDVVHFTLTIDNIGNGAATSVAVVCVVPAEFGNIINLTSTHGIPNLAGNTVTLNLASFPHSQTTIIEFDATAVSLGVPDSTFTIDCTELPLESSNTESFTILVQQPLHEWDVLNLGSLVLDGSDVTSWEDLQNPGVLYLGGTD